MSFCILVQLRFYFILCLNYSHTLLGFYFYLLVVQLTYYENQTILPPKEFQSPSCKK